MVFPSNPPALSLPPARIDSPNVPFGVYAGDMPVIDDAGLGGGWNGARRFQAEKKWRFVGLFGPEVIIGATVVQTGLAGNVFERDSRTLHHVSLELPSVLAGDVDLSPGRERIYYSGRGLNLVEGHNDYEWTENGVWKNGELTYVGHAIFDYPDDLIEPWTVRTEDGSVDLTFTPEGMSKGDIDMKLIASTYRAPLGTYSGTLLGESVTGLVGVAENHTARW